MEEIVHIFCCCSHSREDQQLLSELKSHLSPLKEKGLIHIWDDVNLPAGTIREQAITALLEQSDLILLCVSAEFLTSEYCSRVMKRAMERLKQGNARVIPIILRPCAWRNTPFSGLQVLPKGAYPVTNRQIWDTTDEAFLTITEGIVPGLVELLLLKAATTLHQGNHKQALRLYERIIELDRNSSLAFLGKGRVLRAIGKKEEALAAYNEALSLKPDEALYYQEKEQVLLDLQRNEEATEVLQQARQLNPNTGNLEVANSLKPAMIFAYRQYAYHHLIEFVKHNGAKKATLIQYSGSYALELLNVLLREGAQVILYVQDESTARKIGSQFQANRIRETLAHIRSNLGDALSQAEQLIVYKYHAPCSMNVVNIDGQILCMGWYTFEEKSAKDPSTPRHQKDVMNVSGHDRTAVVAWKGTPEFEALDRTFCAQEENYRSCAVEVMRLL